MEKPFIISIYNPYILIIYTPLMMSRQFPLAVYLIHSVNSANP